MSLWSGVVDLRSDTVTRPTAAMRQAMADAEVGDDVFGEDPTVRRLEEATAELLGHEAALFVPSGTMGNQICLHLHGRPGTELICDSRSHVLLYEMGAMAALSGLLPRPLSTASGQLSPLEVVAAIAPDLSYRARTALVVIENTHNVAGGTVYSPEQVEALAEVTRAHGLPLHLDGARVWNAAVALNIPVARLTRPATSVSVCLSKGLGAPVGSLVAGSAALVHEARRVRKMFGGGMRQVGVLAAAGLVALEEGLRQLAEDHENAQRLAQALAEVPEITLDPASVCTNIVIFAVGASLFGGRLTAGTDPAQALLDHLAKEGVLGVRISAGHARFVTHRDVPRAAIDLAIRVLREVTSGLKR